MKKLLYLFSVLLIIGSSLAFIILFSSGWYQQFLPDIGGRQISDIYFLDSLTGWAVTPYITQNDTAYVLKTTNGGNNWIIANIRADQFVGHNKVYFLDSLTGFVCGVSQLSGFKGLSKSIDGGFSWISLNVPDPFMLYDDMSVLNEDTIWLAASSNPTGGVFRTTNGGLSWQQQLSLGSQNPDRIYMYNERIGFIARDINYLRKTTNGGINWTLIVSNDGFNDMYFADSLTGWKCSSFGMKKTTDGGLNWVTQTVPSGGILNGGILDFTNLNKDTIWGTGGYAIFPNNQIRGILYRTTNGGDNWLYQIPDTSIHIGQYNFIKFTDNKKGWAYSITNTGIHTTIGGDTTFHSNIKQVNSKIPESFKLYQNYPNPFNPTTEIFFEVKKTADIKLIVFDINGREIATLINKKLFPGSYKYTFNGSTLSSGIYFYSLIAEGKIIDTKKMSLIK